VATLCSSDIAYLYIFLYNSTYIYI
jgi:hypothetical protein